MALTANARRVSAGATQERVASFAAACINDAIVVADAQRHILEVNPAFTAIFGYTPEEIKG